MTIAEHPENVGGYFVRVESARYEDVAVLVVYFEAFDHFAIVYEIGKLVLAVRAEVVSI